MQTIPLKTPLKRGEKDIKSVKIREPKGGELRGVSLADMSEMKADTVLELTPRISVPPLTQEEVEQLSAIDLMRIGAAILGVSPETDQTTAKPGNDSTPTA